MTNVPEIGQPDWKDVARIIRDGLEEDLAGGDPTSDLLFPNSAPVRAVFRAKADGVAAGIGIGLAVFRHLDENVEARPLVADGARVTPGFLMAEVVGAPSALLRGERLALNVMQRSSGIATLTRQYVDAVAGLPVIILDTRKTAPGLRSLDKYAVRCGGAQNHRMNLRELAMLKDNHIKLLGGVKPALIRMKMAAPGLRIEVEVANRAQVEEAVAAGADIIMLDNMGLPEMRECVRLIAGRAKVEASGSIDLASVRDVAATGVDFISIGRLTHSAPALDISMKVA